MRNSKKLIAIIISCISILAISATALANDTSSTSTTGYGTLTGELIINSTNIVWETSVSYNNDNAYLTTGMVEQNINGNTIWSQNTSSSRGSTGFAAIGPKATGVYQAYGSHGVQGGSTYGAYAVYTYTLT